MRLNRSGLALFASDNTYQGNANGSTVVLRPGRATEAGWITDALGAIQCPVDPAKPDGPWLVMDLTARRIMSGYPFCHFGGGVAAGSTNTSGLIVFADGTLWPFAGRVVLVTADGLVAVTNENHTTLDVYRSAGNPVCHLDLPGPIAQGNQGESDQLDCSFVNGRFSVRVGTVTTLYDWNGGTPTVIADYLPNPASRTTICLDDGSLVQWDGSRTTWRPHDSADGLLLLTSNASFYLDAVEVAGTLTLVYSAGAGQFPTDYRVILTPNFESLPRVDVVSAVAPIGHPLSVGWYFAFHHTDWTASGAPFPDLDPALPCDFIYPMSDQEVAYAITKQIPCVVSDDAHAAQLAPLGLLWALGARNEDGSDLQAQVDALEPLCVKWDCPLLVYNDGAFDLWPTRWPRYAVASIQTYYQPYEALETWRTRSRAIIQQFQTAFPTVLFDICYSAFDRNVPNWPTHALGNLQTVAFDLARELTVLSMSCFDWGRSDLTTIGGAQFHPEIHDRWLALAPAISGPSRWPRPSDFPPTLPEDEMTYDDWAALMVGTPAAIQPTVALDLTKTTQAQLTNQWVNHRIVDMTAQAVGRAPTVAEGAQCLMLIQAGYSDPQIKLKVWNVVQP